MDPIYKNITTKMIESMNPVMAVEDDLSQKTEPGTLIASSPEKTHLAVL
jgi:hypothetical protein